MFLALFLAGPPGLAAAATPPEQDAIVRLFTQPTSADWFDPAFLTVVPLAKITAILQGLLGQYGAYKGISPQDEGYLVHLEKADVPARVVLNGTGLISSMLLKPPIPVAQNLQDLVDQIAAFPGKTSVVVVSDGTVRASHDPDAVLAVGSAAKLAILKALKQAFNNHRLSPETVVPFDPTWRSLPTGILQDWPAATPMTLATLANLMMSLSDNTATGALVGILGRPAIEALTPRNTPFPTPSELFKLMPVENAELAKQWQEGSEAERRALLDRVDALPLPSPAQLRPVDKVEWYMTASELCALLADTADQPALHINPGVANPAEWADITYKGGADIGVVSMATRALDRNGRTHCVAAIWNDVKPVSTEALATPYGGILHALATGQ